MTSYSFKKVPLLLAFLLLGGCSSVAQGVTEAVLEHQETKEDTRLCEIEGRAFDGVWKSLNTQSHNTPKVTKVLMVHGISSHVPGYSNRFQKKLYEKLGLSVSDAEVKTIALQSDDVPWKKGETRTLGTLRVTRHLNEDRSKQLIFYELTWSPITDKQKESLEKDSTNNEGLARADFNGSLKGFLNETMPDLLIYNGNGYQKVTVSVAESVCWMLGDTWDGLPKKGAHTCKKWPSSTFQNLGADDHFFVTHSLGSRITIDTIQNFSTSTRYDGHTSMERKIRNIVRDKEFTVFMMANQLPLLQMGRDAPEVSNALNDYCLPQGKFYDRRVMRKMNVVAFSDPNDLLSYPIPMDFAKNQIDSRICPSVTNVSLNIAEQKNLFDTLSFANPLTAHRGYMEDDRVVELIANGIKRGEEGGGIGRRCRWLESVDF